MTAVIESCIKIDESQVAWIGDSKVKVMEVALDKIAHGSSPEEMHFQYPNLSLAQIHTALAYYYDHQEELDAEILKRFQDVEQLSNQNAGSALQQKLRELRARK